jgi:hypothetical protein
MSRSPRGIRCPWHLQHPAYQSEGLNSCQIEVAQCHAVSAKFESVWRLCDWRCSVKPEKKPGNIQEEDQLYGRKVIARHPSSGKVSSVICCFCVEFRREKDGAKEKASANEYSDKFRADTHKVRQNEQHPDKWAE